MTTEFLRILAAGLGSEVSAEVLPANVLARTPDVLTWWTPSQHRTMFFAENSEAGKELNGRRYPHPPLVFKVAGMELWVWALARNERPKAETRLMTAPYWNTSDQGYVCVALCALRNRRVLTRWRFGNGDSFRANSRTRTGQRD